LGGGYEKRREEEQEEGVVFREEALEMAMAILKMAKLQTVLFALAWRTVASSMIR
jgi:hypothetical protein